MLFSEKPLICLFIKRRDSHNILIKEIYFLLPHYYKKIITKTMSNTHCILSYNNVNTFFSNTCYIHHLFGYIFCLINKHTSMNTFIWINISGSASI